MARRNVDPGLSPATRVVLKVAIYYAVLLVIGSLVWRFLPAAPAFASHALEPIFGIEPTAPAKRAAATLDQQTLAVFAFVAMISAILLAIPVAWVYALTRAKRGYQQSVVQLLVMLPVVVAGIVVLVKYSVALAFSLAGIVAAVRFRNTLEDSKDAVYVFLSTGIGLASAVDIPVAMVISILFNATILVLWYSDFGHAPVALDGAIAERRLQRAKELARTGTFVARIDDEVFKNMSAEQLEGVAERAWRRAHGGGDGGGTKAPGETRLKVRTLDIERMRKAVDPLMDDYAKDWRTGDPSIDGQGILTIEYILEPKKSADPDVLLALVRAACGEDLVEAELR
jgi:Domain of unknown function (DUF4956)